MLVSILHLSDIHITTPRDLVLKRAEAIAKTTNVGSLRADVWVILLSGDIAFSGKPEQYESAETLINEIRRRLQGQHTKSQVEVVVVPGNHDCDFSLETGTRRMLLPQILGQPDAADESVIALCLEVQAAFFRFVGRIEGTVGKAWVKRVREFSVAGSRIRFNCYNTAWVSQRKEKQGDLTFPPQLHDELPLPELAVSVFHHPLAWFKPDNRRVFQTHLERTSDVVVTGHEHYSGLFSKQNHTGEAVEYCEGGALQLNGESSESEFNIIQVNTSAREHKFSQYSWSEGAYVRKLGYDDWKAFVYGAERKAGLAFTDEFEEFLGDPGAQFTHPSRDRLTLEDIFVYPDLRELRIPPVDRELNDIFGGKIISNQLATDLRNVVVYGADDSGKSSLIKAWCRDLTKRHFATILLSSTSTAFADTSGLEQAIRKQELLQYGPMRAEAVSQLPADRRVVIVDDFHRSQPTRRKQILDALSVTFGTIVVVGAELLKFQEIALGDAQSNPLFDYKRFELMPFGHVRRARLIERWYDMSRQAGVDETTLTRKTRETTAAINLSTSNDVVPSLPLFLLIIIQSYEALSPMDNPASGSRSYGYFHEVLITRALAAPGAPADTDTSYKYLSELAYYMFSARCRRLSEAELRERHAAYCSDYKMSLGFEPMLLFLEASGVLHLGEGAQYAFKYKYLYHYFVAHALAHDVRRFDADAERLIEGLHREESASILMFLVYLLQDDRILTRMLAKARTLYAQATPCDLDKDVALFNGIQVLPGSLLLPSGTAQENRQSMLEARDGDTSRGPVEEPEEDDFEANAHDVNIIVGINAALKTIQVLGQIVKSFPGSTRGDLKLEIVETCCSLGLRAMNALLALIKDNTDQTRRYLEDRLKTTGVSESEVGGKVESLIYWMGEMLVLTFLFKTSEAVGLKQLGQTYDDLVQRDPSLGVALVDLAVRLEHFTSFPENKVNALMKRTKDVRFTRGILVRVVYRHFYLYETDYKILNRFSSKLQIRRATPEAARIESKTRKRN